MTCRMIIGDGTTCEFRTIEVQESCPCGVFRTHDCVPNLKAIEQGRLFYSVTLPDRSGIKPLIQSLQDQDALVTVSRILPASEKEEDATDLLTDAQSTALDVAIEAGYFERPREATLDDLAEELDISASAVSQRLRRAQRSLIDHYARRSDGLRDSSK